LKAAFFPPAWRWVPARDRDHLVAIVTVADDGGSSGRLRQAYRVLPPGDIRNCLLALADGDSTMSTIFDFRFNGGEEVGGHSLGNLILTALSQLERDFSHAVERGSEMLSIRGRVFPSTLEDVTLKAVFDDGSEVEGESRIASVRRPIRRICLHPEGARALPQALDAIGAAHLIVIGPGSLYTSLIPILLVKQLADALADSAARIVLVMNLMSEPGETDGHTGVDHLLAIRRHAPRVPIHDVLLNTTPIPEKLIEYYAAEGARPVPLDTELLHALGCQPVECDLLSTGPKIRHDPHKLGKVLLELGAEAAK
jgi:uncharacterized cofD-like protein